MMRVGGIHWTRTSLSKSSAIHPSQDPSQIPNLWSTVEAADDIAEETIVAAPEDQFLVLFAPSFCIFY